MEEHYLNKIYYRKNKFLKRPTIIFVHGLSGSSSAWFKYEDKFEKKYNILSFDLRGHGKSLRPERFNDYAIHKFSEDLHKIIKKEKLSKFILVSHSFGNLIALDFLKKYQKLMKAVIFVSPDYAPSRRLLAKIVRLFLSFLRPLTWMSYKKQGDHIDYSNYIGTGDWNLRRMYADVSNTGLKSYLNSTIHSYYFNEEKFLREIKIPTLIIHGKKDSIFLVESSKIMVQRIKHSRLILLNNADHIIVLNHFERLSSEIERFVDSLK